MVFSLGRKARHGMKTYSSWCHRHHAATFSNALASLFLFSSKNHFANPPNPSISSLVPVSPSISPSNTEVNNASAALDTGVALRPTLSILIIVGLYCETSAPTLIPDAPNVLVGPARTWIREGLHLVATSRARMEVKGGGDRSIGVGKI